MIQPLPHGMIKYIPADGQSAENLLPAPFKGVRTPGISLDFRLSQLRSLPLKALAKLCVKWNTDFRICLFTSLRKGNGL